MEPKRLQKRTARRKRAIVEAAMGIVASTGPEGLTVGSLAQTLDLSPGALYRYFPSKDHILAEVERAVIEEIAELFASVVVSTAARSPMEQVLALVDAYYLLEEQRSPHFQVLTHFLTSSKLVLPDELATEMMMPSMKLFGSLASVLAQASAAGELDDGDSLERSMVLWSALHGVLERRKLSRLASAAIDIRRLYISTAESLLVGWGANRKLLLGIWSKELPQLRKDYIPHLEAVS